MRTASFVLFTALLTSLIYFVSSQLKNDREFHRFLYRLEKDINATSVAFLPFTLPVGVILNLRWTSNEFKRLCLEYSDEHAGEDDVSPITALEKTIFNTFDCYKKSSSIDNVHNGRQILEEIESVDPIGLNVYLTKNNVEISSPMFMDFVAIFMETMKEREQLFSMKSDIYFFERNNYIFQRRLAYNVRDEYATEYGDLSNLSIDMFTDLVTELTSNRMYSIATTDLNVYQEHTPNTTDDVQIIFGTYRDDETYWTKVHEQFHAICICYKASTEMVHVYDSSLTNWIDAREEAIIQKLYPYNKGVYFEQPRVYQDQHPTCAIFAITYATMLILGQDPAITPIKVNNVHGDKTLYMRIHILNMLAARKLYLLK